MLALSKATQEQWEWCLWCEICLAQQEVIPAVRPRQ